MYVHFTTADGVDVYFQELSKYLYTEAEKWDVQVSFRLEKRLFELHMVPCCKIFISV